MQKQIWVIRHAENSKDESTDLPLTNDGRLKTASLAHELIKIGIPFPVLIISTPVLRGKETSDIMRREFEKATQSCVCQIETMDMAFSSPEEAVRVISLISSQDQPQKEGGQSPSTIVLICHKNDESMHLLYVMLDPFKFMSGTSTELPPTSDIHQILLESQKTHGNDRVSTYRYLDALGFLYKPQNWSDFNLACGTHFQTLHPEIS